MSEQTEANDKGRATGRGTFESRYAAKICPCCGRKVTYLEDGICNPCWTMGAVAKADNAAKKPGAIPLPSTRARQIKFAERVHRAAYAVLASTDPTIDLLKLAIESCCKVAPTGTKWDHLIDDVSEALQIELGEAMIRRRRRDLALLKIIDALRPEWLKADK